MIYPVGEICLVISLFLEIGDFDLAGLETLIVNCGWGGGI